MNAISADKSFDDGGHACASRHRREPGGVVLRGSIARLLLTIMWVAATSVPGDADEDERLQRDTLPRIGEMETPTAEALFKADDDDREFDWVVLTSETESERRVVVCNPIFPRPDTLEKLAAEYATVDASKTANQEEREAKVARLKELQGVLVTLQGNVVQEYRVPVNLIDHIVLFEDLMLRRVDLLLDAGDIRTAYDLLLRVENEIPAWAPSVPRFERLLLVESEQRGKAGETYAALALLDEVANRNLNNPELQPRFTSIVGPMINAAIDEDNFRKARYLIDRVRRVFPEHEVVVSSVQRMQQLAADVMSDAAAKYQQKDFVAASQLAARSASIQTPAGNAQATYMTCMARHQVLRVAVTDFGDAQQVFPNPIESRERTTELLEVPLFEPSSADALTYFRSSTFEIWDPADLGREVVFKIRETRPFWQSQRLMSANDVADALGHRIDPASPVFSPRLASFVSEISVRSPSELRLRFARVPLSIESLLRFPVTGSAQAARLKDSETTDAADDSTKSVVSSTDDEELDDVPVVVATRFKLSEQTADTRSFTRMRPEPDGLEPGQYHIAEVQERKFASRELMMQAMLRGEIDYLPSLLPWEVDAFRASTEFATKQYAIPMTHVIAFNPMSERITSAQMRRALSFAVNREGILQSIVLRDDAMKYGRPTSAAWHLESYATNPTQPVPEFNMRLAFALRFAAERQLQIAEIERLVTEEKKKAKAEKREFDAEAFRKATKADYIKLPVLRFVVEPDPTAMAAAQRMMVYWERIGFQVQLIPGDQSGAPLHDDDWDLCYRRVRMEEPLLELWPLLSSDLKFDMNRLGLFPDWMRQELIGLDYASSFLDAQKRLYTIHSHIAAQAFLIPLWEVDEFAVWRKTVLGIPERPMSTYQNVERWIVRP